MLLPKSSSRQCHERMVVMSLVMVLAVLSQESSAQSGKPRATVSSEYGDTKGDLLSTTVIAVAAGAIVVVILCVLVFFIAITTAVVVKRRRGSYSLPTENEYAGEQQQQPTHANITPPLPPRTAEMFQMIELHHSPSLSSRKSPPLPPRTAEMFELIDNFCPPSSDMSSVDAENDNVPDNDSQNQDQIISNTAVSFSVIQNKINAAECTCNAPPIPPRPRPSSSNDHSYYNMSAVIAAVNPMLLGETPIPPRPSRSTTPPTPLHPKPTKQSHSRLRSSLPSKSSTTGPVNTQTKIEASLDELPESDRQCLPITMADEKLKFKATCTDVVNVTNGGVESCDIGMTSEESLDMWPPVVPQQTDDVFFLATNGVQNELYCEDLDRDNINLTDNVAYTMVVKDTIS